MTDDQFWRLIRQAALLVVDAIERWRGWKRTAELRREWKRRNGDG